MKAPVFPEQGQFQPMSTGVIDRINFAMHFEKYRDMVIKRWWIIATCIGLGLLYGGYKNFRQPDQFAAYGRMNIRPKIDLNVGTTATIDLNFFMATQIQIMQSAPVREAARAKLMELERKLPQPPDTTLYAYQLKGTTIFQLEVRSTSAEYARRYLDELMEAFIAYDRKVKDDASQDSVGMLAREIERFDQEKKKAQEELYDFQKKNNINLCEAQRDQASQLVIDFKRRLAELKHDLRLLDAEAPDQTMDRKNEERLAAPRAGVAAAPGVSNAPPSMVAPTGLKLVSDCPAIKNALMLLRGEREAIGKDLKPKHPKLQRLDDEIAHKNKMLEVAMLQAGEQIRDYRAGLQKTQKALEESIVEYERMALENSAKAAQFEELKATLTRVTEFHDLLQKKSTDVRTGATLDQGIVAISEHASGSSRPVGPNRTKDLLVSALLGLLSAAVIIFLLERFDDRVKTLEDLQDTVQETVLGQIPLMPNQNGENALITLDLPPQNTFSEAFRNVRSSLMFSPLGGRARLIAVTSAIPSDGKTTCSVNLAVCLAQIEGGRTLLVDADMRKMNVHRYFKMENRRGLSEVLSGQASVWDCIVPTAQPNLDLLCAGSSPPNPGELILSDRFRALVADLGKRYQRVVIDTPPILATDDTLSLAPSMDGVVFVVKASQTSIRFITMSLASLKQRGAKIFGLILNSIDTSSAHHYYYYYYSNYYHSTSNRKHIPKETRPASTGSSIAAISDKAV